MTYVKKSKNNTGDNQMYQEIEFKAFSEYNTDRKEWPEEKLHLARHQLTPMLNKIINSKFIINYK